MVADGLLTAQQLAELLELKEEGTRLLKLIVEKAKVSDMDMVVCMGRVLNTPPINLTRIGIPHEVAELLPKEIAPNHKVVPVSRLGNRLYLAMADPLNVLAFDDVKRITKLEFADDRLGKGDHRQAQQPRCGHAAAWRTSSRTRRSKPRRIRMRTTSRGFQGIDRGGQPGPIGRVQRRSSGHQAGQPDPRPGHQGSGERYSHRAF